MIFLVDVEGSVSIRTVEKKELIRQPDCRLFLRLTSYGCALYSQAGILLWPELKPELLQ